MTSNPTDLIERLRAWNIFSIAGMETSRALRNPDGPEAANTLTQQESEIETKDRALRKAEEFITNGIDLGYIRMPDADCPDSAHQTLPMIRAALSTNTGVINKDNS